MRFKIFLIGRPRSPWHGLQLWHPWSHAHSLPVACIVWVDVFRRGSQLVRVHARVPQLCVPALLHYSRTSCADAVLACQFALYFSIRPCAFFSMFLVTRPCSFWLKTKKKTIVKIKLTLLIWRRDRRRGRNTCMLHLQTRGYRCNFFTVIVGGGIKTFSFCVVWWKKTIGATSHIISYSKSMMPSIHAHLSKLWANFNAFLRWSSGAVFSERVWSRRTKATMPPVEIAKNRLCWQ